MNTRYASTFGFSGTVIVATLAAACMTGTARAEYPSVDILNFTGTRTRAEVRAEVVDDRALVSTASNEWSTQRTVQPMDSGLTRAEARAGYIGARDEVHAMTGEDSGTSWMAQPHARMPAANMVAIRSGQ
jgi:hypothetical protein